MIPVLALKHISGSESNLGFNFRMAKTQRAEKWNLSPERGGEKEQRGAEGALELVQRQSFRVLIIGAIHVQIRTCTTSFAQRCQKTKKVSLNCKAAHIIQYSKFILDGLLVGFSILKRFFDLL